MTNRRHFFSQTGEDDTRRHELISKIEHAIGNMSLSELEALSYDMFTKGYIEEMV